MRTSRSVVVLSGTATAVLLLAGPASAHVTAHSTDAHSGAMDAAIAFRVPNEQDKGNVTKIVIALPADKPFAGVLARPVAGWTVAETSVTLATPITTDDGKIDNAVSTITWTATNGGYGPGNYQDFDITVGLLPTTDSVTFKAIQTYSDGTVVSWIQTQPAGGTQDLDHPAPVLALGPAVSSSASPAASATPVVTAKASSSEKTSSNGLGIAALALGAIAVLLSLTALLRGRSSKL